MDGYGFNKSVVEDSVNCLAKPYFASLGSDTGHLVLAAGKCLIVTVFRHSAPQAPPAYSACEFLSDRDISLCSVTLSPNIANGQSWTGDPRNGKPPLTPKRLRQRSVCIRRLFTVGASVTDSLNGDPQTAPPPQVHILLHWTA